MNFKEFYTRGITHHLKERKRLDSQILLFVLHTYKNGKLVISPIISYTTSPMDHAQKAIDSLQPEMYLICAETWIHESKDLKGFMKDYEYGKVQAQKDKYECLVFIAKTMDGKEHHTEQHKIIRKDKKIVDYEKLDWVGIETPKLK